ncbi:glycosyltransferase family 4 protein [Chloroflexus sp.]|uniref:glycosyltransferase family 4 protein n=1 Tax=Chloroflexus sp. TaxID=1904827 RepID=UPI00298EDFB7|nr:glycosyltransferase family 4 protein [Chloroflexus sp.]MDW8403145.1 glycosyltransferase family 4 protein [Chloroflexus sp.]
MAQPHSNLSGRTATTRTAARSVERSLTAARRIVHISTVHQPFDQRIFYRECASAAAAGYETHLLAPLPVTELERQGVHLHSVGAPADQRLGLALKRRWQRLRRAAALARQLQADLYHLHDPELIPLGLWLKATTQARVVFDCHENNTAYIRQKRHLQPFLRRGLELGMAAMERLAARSFDAIVTADHGVADLYLRRFGARRVVTIHNFPHLDLFLQQPPPDDEAPFDLVYHGTIPRYHLEVTFAVAEALRRRGRRARWLFFGKCPEAAWAQTELERRGWQADIVLDPNLVPHDQVAARVRQAKIGFIPLPDLPKFQHNIPTKLFEFMALGMPTVLSDLPPSRPFVGDGRCAIMVPPDDSEAYAEAIIRLLDDPALRREMGAEGRVRVINEFNWQREAQYLLALYAELL